MEQVRRILAYVLNPRSRTGRFIRGEGGSEGSPKDNSALVARSRLRPRHIVFNLPLMLGSALVLALFLIAVFGPLWAPKNPYIASQHIVPHYDFELEEYIRPPLPPSAEFPLGTDRWGNDLLSLMMHGARNTLVACAFITTVRILLGLVLGGLAGWTEGSAFDRVIMGTIAVITSVPTLISSMLLIYALDIRKGLVAFIIALSLIGWAEIAQYIRSEFMVLRKRPFIEGARATGLNGLAIAVRHVLPNVLPQMLVITFLEMGAVMMLLGELGFIGVYIGGGSQIPVATDPNEFEVFNPVGIPDVPEWGVILAEGFRFLRSDPFVVMPPAVAFFISVVAFNALGEGLRRLVEQAAFSTGFLLRKRMVLVVLALTLATVFVMNNTGPAPWYTKVAGAFDGDVAYEHVRALAGIEGRGAGQPGAAEAASYIADKFKAYGLDTGDKRSGFIETLETRLVRPLSQPSLALVDNQGQPIAEFRHQLDFGFVIDGHGGSGDATAPLVFVGFERQAAQLDWESYRGLDLRGRIAMAFEQDAPTDFATEALIRGVLGILWITGEENHDTRSQIQLADPDSTYLSQPAIPIFRIRPAVAQSLLEVDGSTISDLPVQDRRITQAGTGWFAKEMGAVVRMSLSLSEPEPVEIPCVIGYKIGSDFELSAELVILYAAYDSLGMDPDGTIFPGANHNASSIALMLEIARLWHEQDLNARRSVVFVAWGGGQLDDLGAQEYLNDRGNFPRLTSRGQYRRFAPAIIIQPDSVGSGSEPLVIHPDSDRTLAELLRETASQVRLEVTMDPEGVQPRENLVAFRQTRWLGFEWSNAVVPPDEDRLETIEADRLQLVGEAFALALTKIVRQSTY